MRNSINIEKYQNGQEKLIYQLIKKVYDDFVAIDYSEEGNVFFYDWIAPSKIASRQQARVNLWVAMDGTKIVGMIEMRAGNIISLLFVDKKYMRQGIARRLFDEARQECLRRNPKLNKFEVHASPYSVPAYEKLGFEATGGMQEEHGIKYLPMECPVTPPSRRQARVHKRPGS